MSAFTRSQHSRIPILPVRPVVLAGAFLAALPATHAQVTPGGTFTDKAIFVEAEGGDLLDDQAGVAGDFGSELFHDFDTTVHVDPTYELTSPAGAPSDIELSSGRHLVIYSTRFDDTGTNRAEMQTYLALNFTPLVVGRSQGYIRNTGGGNATVMTGGGIITVPADGDVLTLETVRTDTNPNDNVDPARTANATSIQLLKLDDSWDFLSASREADQGGVVGINAVDVIYEFLDPDSNLGTAFSFSEPSGDIILEEAGFYLVFANTGMEKVSNNTRTSYQQFLTLDGVEVPGSKTTTYVRGNANGEEANRGVTALGTILSATAGQVLNVEMILEQGGTNGTIKGGQTAITIVKLPPTTKTIQLFDDSNQEVNDPAVDPVTFGTQVNPPAGDFTHVPGESTITVNADADYLFFGTVLTDSDAANDNQDRIIPLHGWQVDGSGGPLPYGQGAQYNRDNGNNRTAASWAGGIIPLTSGQTVQMVTQGIGNGDLGAGSVVALQALSIASLEVTNDPAVSVNNVLPVLPNETVTVTKDFLETFDLDTPPANLTYTVTSAPVGGTLRHTTSGPINTNGTFTQDDIDNNRIEFDAGAVAVLGGFDFTVSDGSASDAGSFVINVAFPATEVTITAGGNVTEGESITFTVNASVAPVGANLTVDFVYSGSATDGSDFTGVASVDILDGQTSAMISVPTAVDGLFEGTESVTASIGSMNGATVTPSVGSPGSATALVFDGSNSAPTAANLVQVSAGTGTVDLADIVVTDADADYDSVVVTAGTPLFESNGIANLTVFSDGRDDAGSSFDLDATGPALNQNDGMSVEIKFVPDPADLTGVVMVWEIGGSSNGTAIVLVDGVPHLLSKAGGNAGNAPTDDGTVPGAFSDLDWADDNNVVVPLDGGNALTAGIPSCIAVVYDIAGGFVWSSVNGSPETTNVLLNQDNTNFRGDHSVRIGINAGTGTGGSNNGTGLFGTSAPASINNLANGNAAVSSVRFWNEATGTAEGTAGTLDQVTVTLTIRDWAAGKGDLTANSGNGESYSAGEWTISGDAPTVNAALAAVQFVTGAGTADPTLIDVAIEDGDEDGGGPTTGTIVVTAVAPNPIYVDPNFAGSIGDPITDADPGQPGDQAATFGLSAFSSITDALGAATPDGTVIINDGDYTTESVEIGPGAGVTLQLADTAGPVQIGDLQMDVGNAIVLTGSNTLELGFLNTGSRVIDSVISGTGNLTKVGTGRLIPREVNTYTGTTTVNGGQLRVGFEDTKGIQGEMAGDGPVVIAAGTRYELNVNLDNVITQTGQISGEGLVATQGDGTVIFDGPANTHTGGFELGDGATSNFDGIDTGNKNGFVVVNDNGHLGPGLVLSRGSQLQAGTPGLVIPNDIDVTGGGFRCGGIVDFELSGNINPIDNSTRGYGNYGLDGTDLTISGDILLASQVNFEGVEGKDNGSWTVTGDISGPSNLVTQSSFDDGLVVLTGTNTYTGNTTLQTGTTLLNGTHTGGGGYTVQGAATFGGTGSTDAAVLADGTVSPGHNGPGILSTGDLTVLGSLAVDINNVGTPGTDFDQVVVTGTVDVTGADIAIGGSGSNGGTITVIDNDLADSVIGDPTVSGTTSGNVGGTASTSGGDGNDVDLVLVGVGPVDTDGDNIPDGYELANGLDPNDPTDRLSDLDGDGFSAVFEYAMGTLAGDPASKPIFQVSHVSATQVEITYGPITSGVTYRVLSSTTGENFTELDSFTAGANAATNVVVDATGGEAAELYQLSIDLPLP